MNTKHSLLGTVGAVWGIFGWVMVLGYAIYRLSKPVIALNVADMRWYHWVVVLVFTGLLLYFKGYHLFQRGIAPRIGARARYLREHPRLLWVLFAPLFCMGYFHIIRRKQVVSVVMTTAMIILIILVKQLPSPWRAVVDVGILSALSWGVLTIVWYGVKGLTAVSFPYATYIEG